MQRFQTLIHNTPKYEDFLYVESATLSFYFPIQVKGVYAAQSTPQIYPKFDSPGALHKFCLYVLRIFISKFTRGET